MLILFLSENILQYPFYCDELSSTLYYSEQAKLTHKSFIICCPTTSAIYTYFLWDISSLQTTGNFQCVCKLVTKR